MGKKVLTFLVIAALAYLYVQLSHAPEGPVLARGVPKGLPIAAIADGKTAPQIGLVAPLPAWLPLPEKGTVFGAGVYPPQPPYGSAATIALKFDGTGDAFIAAYRARLEQNGFALRSVPVGFNLIVDRPDAVYEADERSGGREVFVVLRGGHYAQITSWNPPVPRM